jgi:hypothetical protein
MDQKKRIVVRPGLFAKTGKFSELYPYVVELRMKAAEYHYSETPVQVYRFNLDFPPGEYISCSNKRCNNGRFRVGSVIRDIVLSRASSSKTNVSCDSKPRRNQQQCLHFMELEIEVKYADQELYIEN